VGKRKTKTIYPKGSKKGPAGGWVRSGVTRGSRHLQLAMQGGERRKFNKTGKKGVAGIHKRGAWKQRDSSQSKNARTNGKKHEEIVVQKDEGRIPLEFRVANQGGQGWGLERPGGGEGRGGAANRDQEFPIGSHQTECCTVESGNGEGGSGRRGTG